MILFFFLLLMLALAWGVADHYQSLLRHAPPPAAPARVEQRTASPPTFLAPGDNSGHDPDARRNDGEPPRDGTAKTPDDGSNGGQPSIGTEEQQR